jgi:hypothetical protein
LDRRIYYLSTELIKGGDIIRPVLYLIPSFDKNVGTTIKFSWLGNVPSSNTLRIKNNDTNEIVYEQTQTTMKLEHVISNSNNLVNGTLYNVSIKVTDSNNVSSEWSDVLLFYCYTTPTFNINITEGQIIQAQTYGVEIIYDQLEGELLQSYRVQVFNSNNENVYDSNVRYILDTVKITNLQDNSLYTIVATGTTVSGIPVTTGAIHFTADFIKSEAYFICELQNMYDTGGVFIKTNIISVEGHSDSEVVYIDNEYADLTNNKVYFDEGFALNKDFSILTKGKSFDVNSTILEIKGNDEIVIVNYKHEFDLYYFELEAIYGKHKYIIRTYCPPISDNEVSLWIRRKNALFGMEVL